MTSDEVFHGQNTCSAATQVPNSARYRYDVAESKPIEEFVKIKVFCTIEKTVVKIGRKKSSFFFATFFFAFEWGVIFKSKHSILYTRVAPAAGQRQKNICSALLLYIIVTQFGRMACI